MADITVTILLTAGSGGYLLETTEYIPDSEPKMSTRYFDDLLKATVALTTTKRHYLGQRQWQVEVYDAVRNKTYVYPETEGEAPPPEQHAYNIL